MAGNGDAPGPVPVPVVRFPAELLEQLNLPATFVPAPLQWHHVKVQAGPGAGLPTWHLLIFDTATGRTAVAFSDADMRAMLDKLFEALSGIQVARRFDG